ncbi:MAG: hypothetical protein ABI912_03810 [Actinomycetota bacterium]
MTTVVVTEASVVARLALRLVPKAVSAVTNNKSAGEWGDQQTSGRDGARAQSAVGVTSDVTVSKHVRNRLL